MCALSKQMLCFALLESHRFDFSSYNDYGVNQGEIVRPVTLSYFIKEVQYLVKGKLRNCEIWSQMIPNTYVPLTSLRPPFMHCSEGKVTHRIKYSLTVKDDLCYYRPTAVTKAYWVIWKQAFLTLFFFLYGRMFHIFCIIRP